ncbi:uncharacterized protein CPUR_01473 [Claviceps purpurea 20.1]|uniref:Uncharacterized protein n=1 Tax=Claviceps purpurea (strain 20.1) TaxID=1111077 RepID=M1WB20_CLAP2|nr:hypothetical protein E4U11_007515 [Claviceps purpurea]CCE27999.1 uncharacterized protein CPUR_01473 [Claviceps purpurea 20.1]KAG6187678.1 hypothetical protein E4U36_007700 [Claviceps purpurea]KAG6197933.1 hypothetical protein E4U50_007788 [Claviceps purpurea]KAG6283177.1 hypothetical protein E4U48_001534 [Claviceps purpurea]
MGFLTDGLHITPSGVSRPKHRRDSSRPHKKHARSRSRSSSSSHRRPRGNASGGGLPSLAGLGGAATSMASALVGGLRGESAGHHGHGHGHSHSQSQDHYQNHGYSYGTSNSKHNATPSFLFGVGSNHSRSSFFNFGNRSSYYKRSSRQNFMQRTYKRLKRLLRDLVHYAKSHPWKVFSLVLMPLLTTGILGSLLARFGLRIPPSLERLLGAASRAAATGDSLGLVTDAVRMAGDLRRGPGPESGGRVRTQTQTRWETKPAGYGSYGSYDSYDTYRGSYRGEAPYTRGQSARSTSRGGGGYGEGLDEGWGSTVVDMARKFF